MEQEDKAQAEAVEEAGEEAEREEEEKEAIQRDPCQKGCPCSPFFTWFIFLFDQPIKYLICHKMNEHK